MPSAILKSNVDSPPVELAGHSRWLSGPLSSRASQEKIEAAASWRRGIASLICQGSQPTGPQSQGRDGEGCMHLGEGLQVGLRSPAHPNGAPGAAGGNRRRAAPVPTPQVGRAWRPVTTLRGRGKLAGAVTMEGAGEKTAVGAPFF